VSIVAVTTLIVLISLGLLLYWFRYLCLLILRDTRGRNYQSQVASANHLTFPRAKALLSDRPHEAGPRSIVEPLAAQALDRLEASLDRDYRVVTYLLHNTAAYLDLRPQRFVLTLDFHLMRFCYRLLRGISRQMAKRVVFEMAVIVGHLAQYAGERIVQRRA
jgi:hypothetical protein